MKPWWHTIRCTEEDELIEIDEKKKKKEEEEEGVEKEISVAQMMAVCDSPTCPDFSTATFRTQPQTNEKKHS